MEQEPQSGSLLCSKEENLSTISISGGEAQAPDAGLLIRFLHVIKRPAPALPIALVSSLAPKSECRKVRILRIEHWQREKQGQM